MADHMEKHQFEMFKANVQDLLGEHPAHDMLAGLSRSEQGGGKGVWIDGIDAMNSEDATTTKLADKATRMQYELKAAADQTFANYMKTKTPGMDIAKIRTWSDPNLIEWGHYFDEDEEWQHLTDPKGKEVNVGVRKVFKERDEMFMQNLIAPTVARKDDNGVLQNVALPASQVLDDMTYADVSVNTLPSLICEKFDDVWFAKGQPIYCAISAKMARHFRNNSRNQIHNSDFVRDYSHFANGTLPQIDGVTFIVMPTGFMTQFAAGGTEDTYAAWTPDAIAQIEYKGMKVSSGTSIDHRDDLTVYMREKKDFKRTDDLGVCVGDIILP